MTSTANLTFGDKVKKLRELKGWSQQQLAEKGGFSVTFISKFETNAKNYQNPTYSTLNALASALDVTSHFLTEWGGLKSFGEKLGKFRKKKRMTVAKLAKESGIPQDDLIAFEEGEKFPDSKSMLKIAVALETTYDQLIFDRQKENIPLRSIPEIVISPFQGGTAFDDEGHYKERQSHKNFYYCPPDIKDPFAYAVRVSHFDAMEPVIEDGTILICTTNETPKEKDLVILLTIEGGMTAGVINYNGDKIIIKPFHPRDPLETYMKKDVKAIHRVVWIRRK